MPSIAGINFFMIAVRRKWTTIMALQNPFLGIDLGITRDDKQTSLKNRENFKSYCLQKFSEKPASRSAIWAGDDPEDEAEPSLEDELMPFKNWVIN